MERWLEEIERASTVATRVSLSEKQTIERLRKTFRMRSAGNVLRFGLYLVESAASLADVEVLAEDEQVLVLRKFAETVQSSDDDYLKSQQAADDLEEFVAELLGVGSNDSRNPLAGEEVVGTDGGLFDEDSIK